MELQEINCVVVSVCFEGKLHLYMPAVAIIVSPLRQASIARCIVR